MKEQLVSFETAKLAKEKGFRNFCFYYYDKHGKLVEPYEENGSSTDVEFRVDLDDFLENHNQSYNKCHSAPTQSLLQKWLRDEHDLEAYVIPNHYYKDGKLVKQYRAWKPTKTGQEMISRDTFFNTYEQALEKGLQEALKLI